jgi:diaminohydroxyphosphoribosylaminopyrimidine deaminase/5-amino-6-(5-phosphoribosylamino)uracil reductase
MDDAAFMERCLVLAARAEGRTAPNPMVGAVVVSNGEVVGEGYHERLGAAHAESAALLVAGDRARGSTVYVNLEPCAHHGRTPPCTDALVAAGVGRVVAGMIDPYPLVSGKGVAYLRQQGIDVDVGVLESKCRDLNAAYLSGVVRGRPLVVLKAAATLDGRIATVSGESQWITGEAARSHAHGVRNRLDAILVGSKTALVDDPSLTCRVDGGRDPVRIVLDSTLRVPVDAKMFQGGKAIVYSTIAPVSDHPAQVVVVDGDENGVSLEAVLDDLLNRGVHSLLVEGGGQVHRGFLERGLVDRLLFYLSPMVLAGGPGWVGGDPIQRLTEAYRFKVRSTQQLGDDILVELDGPCSLG